MRARSGCSYFPCDVIDLALQVVQRRRRSEALTSLSHANANAGRPVPRSLPGHWPFARLQRVPIGRELVHPSVGAKASFRLLLESTWSWAAPALLRPVLHAALLHVFTFRGPDSAHKHARRRAKAWQLLANQPLCLLLQRSLHWAEHVVQDWDTRSKGVSPSMRIRTWTKPEPPAQRSTDPWKFVGDLQGCPGLLAYRFKQEYVKATLQLPPHLLSQTSGPH